MSALVVDPQRKLLGAEKACIAPTVAARDLLADHPHFRGRADRFGYDFRDGSLIIYGIVPTFYLKQLLQRVLRDVRGVRRIDNRVAVVSPYGLSSHDQR